MIDVGEALASPVSEGGLGRTGLLTRVAADMMHFRHDWHFPGGNFGRQRDGVKRQTLTSSNHICPSLFRRRWPGFRPRTLPRRTAPTSEEPAASTTAPEPVVHDVVVNRAKLETETD